jgi:hypothetical protein
MLKVYQDALSDYALETSLAALRRCYKEHRGHLAPSDIISKMPSAWPDENEAWALCAKDDRTTVVTFSECIAAYNEASENVSDPVAIRMAFREVYRRLRQQGLDQGREPVWFPSLGDDKAGRERVIRAGVEAGKLTEGHLSKCLPPGYEAPALNPGPAENRMRALTGQVADGMGQEPATEQERKQYTDNLPWKKEQQAETGREGENNGN